MYTKAEITRGPDGPKPALYLIILDTLAKFPKSWIFV